MSLTADNIDRFLERLVLAPDPVLDRVIDRTEKSGMPAIAVSPLQGAFLHIMALSINARRILEIGALGGYSTIWLARALPPEGMIATIDVDPRSVAAVRESAAEAELGARVRIFEGAAAEILQAMIDAVEPAFDLIFIDADKTGYPRYLELCLALSRPGTVIIADNVVREGEVAHATTRDLPALAVRKYLEMARAEPRLTTTVLQTVGAKGHDGFAISFVR